MRALICVGLLLVADGLIAAPVRAQTPPPADAIPVVPASPVEAATAASPAPVSAAFVLPANAVVELEMVDAVASDTNKPGDFFKMRVAVPVSSQGQVLVPAGTVAIGQVVHAQKAGGGGKAGELILAARYLELPQGQVKLRSTFGAAGANRVSSSLALSYAVGPFALLVKGKNVAMPAGAALSARLATETSFAPAPPATPGDAAPSTTEPRTTAQ